MARTEVSGSQIKDSSVALSASASPTGASDVTGVLPAANGGTGLAAPGVSGNVLTSDGTNWTSAAGGGGGGGGSARVTSTVTSAVTLGSAANTEYLTYIAASGSVTLPTAVGNTSSYILKNIDTTTKTIATVGDDPNWANVTSLLQGNGVNNSTTITDSAFSAVTWTASGAAKLNTSVKKFGTASISFDATASTAVFATYTTSTNPNVFSGDWTIEMWIYPNSIAGQQLIFDCRPSATASTVQPLIYLVNGAPTYLVSAIDRITGSALPISTWYHLAVCRSGTSTRMFVNGTQVGSTYTDANAYAALALNRPLLGQSAFDGTLRFNGYLDDIRVTTAARYTANFTAPTAEFPISQLIDGTYPLVLAPNQAVELTSSGSNWSVVSDADALPGFSTTLASASITTLTATSNPIQEFTGVTTHTVRLPSAGVVAGQQVTIMNNSTGLLTMQTSTGAQIHVLAPGTESILTALVATPTTALHWEDSLLATSYAAGKLLTVNHSLTLQGTDATTMTFPNTNATIARTDAAQTFTGVQTFSTPVINGTPTGTGVATAATANTLVLRGAGGTVTGTFIDSTTAVGTVGATTTLALAGTVQTATLTSNTPCTVTMPAVQNGASFVLYLRQPATGTPTTATFSGVRWGTVGAPVITAVLGRMDILTFFSDGTNWFGQVAQGYQY